MILIVIELFANGWRFGVFQRLNFGLMHKLIDLNVGK